MSAARGPFTPRPLRTGAATLPGILRTSAQRSPGAVAVEIRDVRWSYGDLHEASSRIAAALVDAGVRPNDTVAICQRKSPETLAALFGILKAGGVFVPLDRTAPASRLVRMLIDCRAKALFGSGRKLGELLSSLPRGAAPAVAIEGPDPPAAPVRSAAAGVRLLRWDEAMTATPLAVEPRRRPSDLACILYTSGSTGSPKGVMIAHENVLAFSSWARRRFDVTPADRVASVAPFHFDLSTFDLHATLEAGATVVLVPEDVALFPAALAACLEAREVTIAYLVPSVIAAMLLRGDLAGRRLDALRTILFAGEVFPVRHLSMLMEAFPRVALFNLYGPTETNVCTYYEVRPADRRRAEPVPIGTPASGDAVFALDERGDPIAEPGREGELYVAGPTVAAGYWGDEARTKERFLETHALAPPGARVFRTGDRVTLSPSGDWIYCGRRDHMVKIRGYRVELGDIEATLYAHADVEEAVAVTVPDEVAGHRVKACVVLKQGHACDAAAIRRHCAERLPSYMVPEIVEIRTSMPRTSSGKVDRTVLAAEDPPPGCG